MKLSEHLKLNLPTGDNTVQISVLTENFKKLDDSYKYTIDKVDAVEHLIENVDFSEIEEQIGELENKLNEHTTNLNNPHKVTKHQIGLNKVDNTSDLEKPVSTAVQKELDLKAKQSDLKSHTSDSSNPHGVTKAQVGLSNVNNTSDLNKPVSKATQEELNKLSTNITVEKERIDELSEEVDTVKQSGVEINKRISDKLNSFGITVSDKDSISTNIGKFESISNQENLNKTILLDDYKNLEGKQTVLNITQGYYTGGKIELERLPDDKSNSPGSKYIKIGDRIEGYFGVVPASQLITGSALTNKVGLTQGTAQYSDTPWHKFAWEGKILFIAQKTIRHLVSWDHLNSKNLIRGDTIIEINGVKYKVRLVKGALIDPSKYLDIDRGAKGSEWNRLVAPLSVQRKDNSWDSPSHMEGDLQDWGTYISDSELTVRNVNGNRNWCQEVSGENSANRVYRGDYGVSASFVQASYATDVRYGWRPVLEVV